MNVDTVLSTQSRARWALFALQGTALLVVGSAGGFPLDDAWIHQVVARNLAVHGRLGFLPDQLSSGSTSLLWTLFLGLNHLTLRAAPVAFAVVAGSLAALIFGQSLLCCLLDDGLRPPRALLLAALATCGGNFAWFGVNGMEGALLAALAAVGVWLWCHPRGGLATALLAGLAFGAAAATRPDALVFAAVLVIPRRGQRPVGHLFLAAIAAVVVAVAALAVHARATGIPLPVTLEGRRWLFNLPRSGFVGWGRMGAFWRDWALHFGVAVFAGTHLVAAVLPVLFLTGSLSVWGAVWLARRGPARLRMLLALAFTHALVFCVLLPNHGHGSRYLPLAVALGPILVFLGGERLAAWLAARRPSSPGGPALRVGIGAALVLLTAHSLLYWRGVDAEAIAHINTTHRKMGQWIRARIPAGAAVASFDIGGVAWDSKRAIVDLGGLVDPSYLPYLWEGRVPEFLRSRHIEYVVLPVFYETGVESGYGAILDGLLHTLTALGPECIAIRLGLHDGSRVALTKIVEFSTPMDRWARSFLATNHAFPRQVLYRVEYGDQRR